MIRKDDAFWDELGVSWRASIPDSGLISSRLEARLKLQSALLTAGTVVGYAITFLGLALAGWAFWIGWSSHAWNFLTRGVTVTIVSLLAIMVILALRAGGGMETRSVHEMLQVSIVRTERLIRAADLTCCAVLILALGGMTGYFLRIRVAQPPAVSPVEDLLALALVALALVWYRRSQARSLRKYRHLSQAFGTEELQ